METSSQAYRVVRLVAAMRSNFVTGWNCQHSEYSETIFDQFLHLIPFHIDPGLPTFSPRIRLRFKHIC